MTNKLPADNPCDLKLWIMDFFTIIFSFLPPPQIYVYR